MGVLPLVGRKRGAEEDRDGSAAQAAAPAGLGARAPRCPPFGLGTLGLDVPCAVQVHGDDRPACAPGQIGGAGGERLGPAVGRAAALGEDDQVPPVLDQFGCGVPGLTVDLAAFDRMVARVNDDSTAFQVRSKK